METQSTWQKIWNWIDWRGRREGGLGFILMRLTAIGLVFYLALHLTMLSNLARGPEAWDSFITLVKNPIFVVGDAVLIFGLVYHAINGIRVTILGLGWGSKYQAQLFWGAFLLSMVLTAIMVAGILAIG